MQLKYKVPLLLEIMSTMNLLVLYSDIFILVFAGVQVKCSSTTEPSVISGFDFGQRMIFTDPGNNNNNPFFHYLNFESKNSSAIYIGALDFLYRLNASDISTHSAKSENLTAVSNYSSILSSSLRTCQSLQSNPKPNLCRNHIRVAFPIHNEIYVCATGANSPQEFYIDYKTLGFVALGAQDPSSVGSSGGTKCPSDPDASYTAIYVDRWHGTPNNMSAIYSSINSDFANGLYRSALQGNRTTPILAPGLQMPLSDVAFVASYEIDQYVYYFFREIASEVSGIGQVRYSRVGRVCKNDNGTNLYRNWFLTYVKATLNCSVGIGSDIPIYYNNLYDVSYDESNRVFYGLFMASQNDSWGSAVCSYSYASIFNKFENGQFYSQESPDSQWTITSNDKVPVSRPSSCQASDTRALSVPVQAFAVTHLLMAGTIDQITTTPLFYNHDIGYSRFTVDVVEGFTVFCLYSDLRPDTIVRVALWTNGTSVSSRIFSILKPFDDNKSTLREMALRRSSGKSWLYIVKDTAVFQISMDLCSQYKLCTQCVSDPYCGWNSENNQCVTYAPGLLRSVGGPSALAACGPACKVESSSNQFCIPGMATHLNCLSHCSPEGTVIWKFPNGSFVQTDNPNYVITPSGGLVILNLTSDLNGIFTCISNNVKLAEHTIKASTCKYSSDIQNIVMMEYKNWCTEFEKYKTSYNEWFCSRQGACSDYRKFCLESGFCGGK